MYRANKGYNKTIESAIFICKKQLVYAMRKKGGDLARGLVTLLTLILDRHD